MTYNTPEWELSNIDPSEIEGSATDNRYFTESGLYTVKIVDAKYYDKYAAENPKMADTYKMTIECVDEGKNMGLRADLTYWLKNENKTMFNDKTLGTMRSLGKAIFGEDYAQMVPAPATITGAVAVAEIKMGKPDALGRTYPKVYHWMSASGDLVMAYSDIEQHYRGKE